MRSLILLSLFALSLALSPTRAAEPFTASNGLVTANGRLRRNALFNHYQSAINALPS